MGSTVHAVTGGRVDFKKQKPDPRLIRLKNPDTGLYLHLSGVGEVKGTEWAWLGYRYQAETMRGRAVRQGVEWPYEPEAREAEVTA